MTASGVVRWVWRLAAAGCVVLGGTAYAAPPASSSSSTSAAHLRPARHRDRLGRTLEDMCPERLPRQRRCFAERVFPGDLAAVAEDSAVRVDAPGLGFGDPSCLSMGGGQGGQSPSPGSMAPNDVLAAYQVPPSTKAGGKTVALIELPSTHAMDDVNEYRRAFGIPELPACPVDSSGVPTPGTTACFARVGEDGTTHSASKTDCAGWSGETGLDMDMVSAACPDCSIVLVEANNTNDLDQMNQVAATVVGAAAASNSWGGPETGSDDAMAYTSPGMLTFAASGDSGYLNEQEGYQNAPSFPASAPTVVAVGGTTLELSGGHYSEVVWNDGATQTGFLGGGALGAGGSGCSEEFARPAWQSAVGFSFGPCVERASVDLSAAAQFNPTATGGGIASYAADYGWVSVEGTSAASPLVAAIMVRLGLAGKDNHDLFYGHIDDFNDVTSGTNDGEGICRDVMCTAGKGWDGPTGLGTPNGERLAQLVAPLSPPDAGSTPLDASAIAWSDDEAGVPDAGLPPSIDDAGLDLEGDGADAACPACSGRSNDSNEAFAPTPPAGCACRSTQGSGNPTGGGAGVIAAGVVALARRRRSAIGASAGARREGP
jgi:MYXO-CTERM domain-containing protein